MVLIIGGFASGKTDFTRSLGFTNEEIYTLTDGSISEDFLATCSAIVLREQGCGLVPMDPVARAQREEIGRLACRLAAKSTAVYRVTCGIGTRIK